MKFAIVRDIAEKVHCLKSVAVTSGILDASWSPIDEKYLLSVLQITVGSFDKALRSSGEMKLIILDFLLVFASPNSSLIPSHVYRIST